MKSASSSSNEIPPAVEIAPAIGAIPLSFTGHGVDQSGEIFR
jgi:hypothetical protein